MQFMGAVSGGGAIGLSAGAMLDLTGGGTISNAVSFGAGGGVLYLGNPGGYTGTIAGFASGDAIELNNFAFNTALKPSVSGGVVTIAEPNGPSVSLTFSTTQTASSLTLGVGPHGGLELIHV